MRRKQGTKPTRPTRDRQAILIAVVGMVGLIAFGAAVVLLGQSRTVAPTAWSRLGSADVHSLSFVGDDLERLMFGHHGGLSESRDGGRTWQPLPTTADAMAMQPAKDGSVVIAGHEVFTASGDGGKTWVPMTADLPSLDIHGFTRDPADPARMWALLATGGLWESTDGGGHWTRVREDSVLFPLAVGHEGSTRLLGVDVNGLVASDDGGRTWTTLGTPPTYPMTALAASSNGAILYAGSPDGLFRSDDAGRSWSITTLTDAPFAVATSPDGSVVAVVARTTEFFRSSDRGRTWPGPNR